MGEFVGMNLVEMREIIERLRAHAIDLERCAVTVGGLVSDSAQIWQGPATSRFGADWVHLRESLLGAKRSLLEYVQKAENSYREQDAASQNYGSASSDVSPVAQTTTNTVHGGSEGVMNGSEDGIVYDRSKHVQGSANVGGVYMRGDAEAEIKAEAPKESHATIGPDGVDAGASVHASVKASASAEGEAQLADGVTAQGGVHAEAEANADVDANAHVGADGAEVAGGAKVGVSAGVGGEASVDIYGVEPKVSGELQVGLEASASGEVKVSPEEVKIQFSFSLVAGLGVEAGFDVTVHPAEIAANAGKAWDDFCKHPFGLGG